MATKDQDRVFSVITLLSRVASEPAKQMEIISSARKNIIEMNKAKQVPSAVVESLWNITIHLQRIMNDKDENDS